jgi:hypothetical protein
MNVPFTSVKDECPLYVRPHAFAERLQDFWAKHVSPTGVPWIALSLSLDKTGFTFRTYDIPEFGRRSQRDLRAGIRASCFDAPTTDYSVHL